MYRSTYNNIETHTPALQRSSATILSNVHDTAKILHNIAPSKSYHTYASTTTLMFIMVTPVRLFNSCCQKKINRSLIVLLCICKLYMVSLRSQPFSNENITSNVIIVILHSKNHVAARLCFIVMSQIV